MIRIRRGRGIGRGWGSWPEGVGRDVETIGLQADGVDAGEGEAGAVDVYEVGEGVADVDVRSFIHGLGVEILLEPGVEQDDGLVEAGGMGGEDAVDLGLNFFGGGLDFVAFDGIALGAWEQIGVGVGLGVIVEFGRRGGRGGGIEIVAARCHDGGMIADGVGESIPAGERVGTSGIEKKEKLFFQR